MYITFAVKKYGDICLVCKIRVKNKSRSQFIAENDDAL